MTMYSRGSISLLLLSGVLQINYHLMIIPYVMHIYHSIYIRSFLSIMYLYFYIMHNFVD